MTAPTLELKREDIVAFAERMAEREGYDAADLPRLERAAVFFLQAIVNELATDPDWAMRHFSYNWDGAYDRAEQVQP